MRICVYGAGSVGGYLAARLAKGGREVAVIARGPHLAAIQADGLTLETPDERFTVPVRASDDPAAIGAQDLVLVVTKTPALPTVARRIAPLLGAETPVVFANNGVFWFYGQGFAPHGRPLDLARLDPDGALHRGIGPERALGLVIYSPNEVVAPGVVRNGRGASGSRFVLGDPSGAPGRLQAVAEALAVPGVNVEPTDEIRVAMWQKLVVNLSSGPVCCLTDAQSRDMVGDPDTRAVVRKLMEEGLAVAASHGFADLGVDPEERTSPSSRPAHTPSMLQDLRLGRPMEIDSMVAIVADFARAAGVATPTLDVVLPLLITRARVAGCYGGR